MVSSDGENQKILFKGGLRVPEPELVPLVLLVLVDTYLQSRRPYRKGMALLSLYKEDEDKTNVLDYEIIGFAIGLPLGMFLMYMLCIPEKNARLWALILRTWDRLKRIDVFELLDTVEEKYTWKLDYLATALLHDKPRVSNFAIDLAFSEPDCTEPPERVYLYAFLLGVKERVEEWWAKFKEGWIIEHGSTKAREALSVRRMKDELEEAGWRWL
jgi:hypothetical protein